MDWHQDGAAATLLSKEGKSEDKSGARGMSAFLVGPMGLDKPHRYSILLLVKSGLLER